MKGKLSNFHTVHHSCKSSSFCLMTSLENFIFFVFYKSLETKGLVINLRKVNFGPLFQTTFQSAMDSIWKYLQFYIFLVSVNILMCPRQSWIIRRYYKKERTKLGLCALLFLIMNIVLTEGTLIRDILWKTVCSLRNMNVDSLGNLSLASS